jgi:hypothetical protein
MSDLVRLHLSFNIRLICFSILASSHDVLWSSLADIFIAIIAVSNLVIIIIRYPADPRGGFAEISYYIIIFRWVGGVLISGISMAAAIKDMRKDIRKRLI